MSLKEQLQALSIVSPSSVDDQHKKKAKIQKQKSGWLEHAQYGVELLKAYFPACFKEMKEVQPLKIGIKQDLVKRLSTIDNIVITDKSCMVTSLAYYVNSPAYHKSVVAGAIRIDLDGGPAGAVTVEEEKYSSDCRLAKAQKKNKSKK
jgi:ProP effector